MLIRVAPSRALLVCGLAIGGCSGGGSGAAGSPGGGGTGASAGLSGGSGPGNSDAGATNRAGTASGAGAPSNGGTPGSGGTPNSGGSGGTPSSGGTGGSGSAGSSGAAAHPPVGKCDNLPAPGMWQDVTPPGKSSRPAVNGTVGAAIIVDPLDPRTVWLGTGGENDEIWRSVDCGATWKQVNTGPGGVGDGKTVGGVGDGAQWSMQVDPVEPGVLYATSGYGAQSLWKTADGGQSWTDVLKGSEYDTHADYRFVNNVSLDPTDHLHVVVSTHGGCSEPYGPSCIGETKDGGKTWRVLKAPEGWAEGGGLVLVKGGLWIWCGSSLMVTTDAGANWKPDALNSGGSCEAEYTIRSFVPAANGNYYLGSRSGVLRSADGEKWEHVAGTSGLMVMIAQGSKQVFAANQWQPSIKAASLAADTTWADLPAPAQISQGSDGGVPFLAFDDAHGVLYASMFSGGVARMVVP
jgi:hypothetical protein